ncbi:MAG: hypothetical protein HYY16_06495 [Planctomycetes bacterium]|nr:hypothetical protein [Planctomycetota bacterium]
MSDPLMTALRAVRWRLKLLRSVEMAVRWTLYASLLACVCLAASKFLPVQPELVLLLAVVPLAAVLAASLRRVSLRECAILIDGAFGLNERVATAAELDDASPMSRVMRADALRALASVNARSVARVRWSRETGFLAAAAALLTALTFAPAPSPAPAAPVVKVQDEVDLLREAARDPRTAEHARELERVAELMRAPDRGKLVEAANALRALEAKIGERLLDGGLSPEAARALRELADRVAGAGAGLARELASTGVEVDLATTPDVERRFERRAAMAAGRSERPEGSVVSTPEPGAAVVVRPSALDAVPRSARYWAPRYDAVLKRYNGARCEETEGSGER